jgi:hypothetical protein
MDVRVLSVYFERTVANLRAQFDAEGCAALDSVMRPEQLNLQDQFFIEPLRVSGCVELHYAERGGFADAEVGAARKKARKLEGCVVGEIVEDNAENAADGAGNPSGQFYLWDFLWVFGVGGAGGDADAHELSGNPVQRVLGWLSQLVTPLKDTRLQVHATAKCVMAARDIYRQIRGNVQP